MRDRATQQRCSTVVHQATGIVAVQADCHVDEGFALLVIRALATNQTVEMTALDVIDHVIRFD
jgi:nitrate/TMAO reductase-like tetraheme cytochrome c subunit